MKLVASILDLGLRYWSLRNLSRRQVAGAVAVYSSYPQLLYLYFLQDGFQQLASAGEGSRFHFFLQFHGLQLYSTGLWLTLPSSPVRPG